MMSRKLMKGSALCFGLLLAGNFSRGADLSPAQYLLTDLGTLPGDTSSTAMDINDSRVVVGYSSVPQACEYCGTKDRAFQWTDHLQELVYLGPTFTNIDVRTRALAINNNNFIVGDSWAYFGTESYAMRFCGTQTTAQRSIWSTWGFGHRHRRKPLQQPYEYQRFPTSRREWSDNNGPMARVHMGFAERDRRHGAWPR